MATDVVVVNYKTPGLLQDFAESYEEHHSHGDTLTIVDVTFDSPYPEQIAAQYGAEFFRFNENVGYGAACNIGASIGDNTVVLLANADTVLTNGLQDCHDALMARKDWGVLGPRQVDSGNRLTFAGIFGTDTHIAHRGWKELDMGQYSDVREDAMSVSGSLYFIKRALWEELTECPVMQEYSPGIVGAFIPTPHYYEETCCSYHARAHGYKIVYYGPVRMIHHWHAASSIGEPERHMQTSKMMMQDFCQRHSIICE